MEEIIKSITQAEEKAEQIKAEALSDSAKIAEAAETEIVKIAEKCEEECKLYREKEIAAAYAEAEKLYSEALDKKRAEAVAYADSVIKHTDKAVADIVRRITRGSR
ncbi:MAG: hypothetical protein K2H30_06800 [Clostridia bacterium]|nr:hypothetical protein [Clostridia bacterium]